MKVRIRAGSRMDFARYRSKPRKFALLLAALMTPASVAAYALGCWRIGSDLDIAGKFVISKGLFSHWQVWIALGGVIQATGFTLGRYGRGTGFDDRDAAAS